MVCTRVFLSARGHALHYAVVMADDKTRQAREVLKLKRTGRWYEDGVRFRCVHPECSRCCTGARGPGYVWVSADDMEAMATHLQISFDEFTRKYIRQIEYSFSLIEKRNYDCVFLKDGKCSVYPVRPTQCRTYPFWPENMRSEFAWSKEGRDCPGINQDESTVSAAQIEQALHEDAKARELCGRDE
jgi:uncharacterized protein